MADLLAYLASISRRGYKVGLYTPHLKDFRERIKINGQDISEECL
jgi:dihydrofolate synthase/folylpolyglutamate synthase